jgi:hypothetical protein
LLLIFFCLLDPAWVGNGFVVASFNVVTVFSSLHNYHVLTCVVYQYASNLVDSLVYFHMSNIYLYSSLTAKCPR